MVCLTCFYQKSYSCNVDFEFLLESHDMMVAQRKNYLIKLIMRLLSLMGYWCLFNFSIRLFWHH